MSRRTPRARAIWRRRIVAGSRFRGSCRSRRPFKAAGILEASSECLPNKAHDNILYQILLSSARAIFLAGLAVRISLREERRHPQSGQRRRAASDRKRRRQDAGDRRPPGAANCSKRRTRKPSRARKEFRHARKGVPHLKVSGKGGKTRYLPPHPGTHGLINDYLDAAGYGLDESGALFRPDRNNRTGRLEDAITADGVYRLVRR